MGEMREFWANVYDDGLGFCQCKTRERAAAVAGTAFPPLFRIHVRLKPEGAPKRYASPHDRWCWENNPKRAAALDELFAMDLPFEWANEGGGE